MITGYIHQPGDFLRDGLTLLDMVEMAGVIADLIHIRRDLSGDLVVFLQIDGQGDAVGEGADLLQRLDFFLVVDGDAHDRRACAGELVHLCDRGVDVARLRRAHALDGHWRAAAHL